MVRRLSDIILENLDVVGPQLHGEEEGQGHDEPAEPAETDRQSCPEDFPGNFHGIKQIEVLILSFIFIWQTPLGKKEKTVHLLKQDICNKMPNV